MRAVKINELTARILIYEIESAALIRELTSANTLAGRRAQIHRRQPRLWFDHKLVLNDLEWSIRGSRARDMSLTANVARI